MNETILEVKDVFKSFLLGNETIEIIKGVSFEIYKGDFVVLFGPSGCGKSTVLNMSLGLETPSKGTIKFLGKDLYLNSDEDERAQLRKKDIGMVYQQSNWVKSLNVIENVYFPLTLRGESVESREKKAWEILDLVDMRKGAYQKPTELSSGQQQRISLARALITDPALLVADEPTGNLDSTAGEEIMNLFRDLNLKGKTVIMVTHDLEYLKYATRSINMADGVVVGEYDQNDSRLKKLSVSKRGNVATNQSTGKS
ncbi:ABC transporter ATP-binding protein [Candidatus Woesebacteria bacterium]|nr:ABC transporter ATP-binding protein [Candidatus Woesebacteria bacterium]